MRTVRWSLCQEQRRLFPSTSYSTPNLQPPHPRDLIVACLCTVRVLHFRISYHGPFAIRTNFHSPCHLVPKPLGRTIRHRLLTAPLMSHCKLYKKGCDSGVHKTSKHDGYSRISGELRAQSFVPTRLRTEMIGRASGHLQAHYTRADLRLSI